MSRRALHHDYKSLLGFFKNKNIITNWQPQYSIIVCLCTMTLEPIHMIDKASALPLVNVKNIGVIFYFFITWIHL